MIGYLQGKIISSAEGEALVGIGSDEQGYVGYSVRLPRRSEYEGLLPGKKIEFHVYTHVREEALDLYGFLSRDEKELFLVLLLVSGVGPKSALSMLSSVEPRTLIQTLVEGDTASLTRVPGVGKKTAERMIVELRDPLRKKIEYGFFLGLVGGARSLGVGASEALISQTKGELPRTVFQDAKAALMNLGYREQEVKQLLERALSEENSPQRPEDLIRAALKHMSS